jgi:hypothetical protein
MAYFDTRTFLKISGGGGDLTTAVGTAFGFPQCLLNLTQQLIDLLPTSVLRPLRRSTQDGADAADRAIQSALSKLKFLDGIIEYDSSTGTFRLVSRSSRNGLEDTDSGPISDFIYAIGFAAGFGGRLYNAYEDLTNQIEYYKQCLGSYMDTLKYTGGNAGIERARLNDQDYKDTVLRRFEILRKDIESAGEFRNKVLEIQGYIDNALDARALNPNLEPEFRPEYVDIVSATDFRVEKPDVVQEPVELIRLSYGPPISKSGKFILSVDGLYFDSQTSGVEPVLVDLENRQEQLRKNLNWKFEFDPNIGGRGKQITLRDVQSYVNTILDDNIIDESNDLKEYYERDEVLTNLIGQKNRRIFDVSSQIVQIQEEFGPQILIDNLRQVMLSENSHHQQKINKRKKQIELAVRLPVLYGKNISFSPGYVPINDFSYLEGINFDIDIQKQRKLILNQTDVSGVVLPLTVNYVQQIEEKDKITFDHLELNDNGLGNIIANGSGTDAPQLSINTSIVKEDLAALYNLLRFSVVDPSSTEFKLKNSSPNKYVQIGTQNNIIDGLNAQLVGRSDADIFGKGVGIAYLEGITKHSKTSPTVPSSIGSYIKLAPYPALKDLFYRNTGGTFELWIHTPNLDAEGNGFNDDFDVSGLYRLILANENTGSSGTSNNDSNILQIRKNNSSDVVRGLIFGFTRDRRLTKDLPPSNNGADNKIEDTCLVLAPTQSFNSSSIGFINKSYDINDNCNDVSNIWYNMRFNISSTVNGVSLSSCGIEFCQIALSFDPQKNKIDLYCDGQLLTTSSYTDVFGIDPRNELLSIPSITKTNSFNYNATSMNNVPVDALKSGPELDYYEFINNQYVGTTPWIIGGGYTDGMQTGNFMGGQYGGIISGLRGFVGGIKFYLRPLSNSEILNNYNASKNFFKNINISSLAWEPVISE